MTRLIGNLANAQSGAVFRLTSLRPIRPANAPDAWERSALEGFERGQKEAMSVQGSADDKQLRYMAPLPMLQSCLACHAKQGYKVGDVRGGISVSLPFAPGSPSPHTRRHAGLRPGVFSGGGLGLGPA